MREMVGSFERGEATAELFQHCVAPLRVHDPILGAEAGVRRKQRCQRIDVAIVDRETIVCDELAQLRAVFQSPNALLERRRVLGHTGRPSLMPRLSGAVA